MQSKFKLNDWIIFCDDIKLLSLFSTAKSAFSHKIVLIIYDYNECFKYRSECCVKFSDDRYGERDSEKG